MRGKIVPLRVVVLVSLCVAAWPLTVAELLQEVAERTGVRLVDEAGVRAELDRLVREGLARKKAIDRPSGHPDKPGGCLGDRRMSFELTEGGRLAAQGCRKILLALVDPTAPGLAEGERDASIVRAIATFWRLLPDDDARTSLAALWIDILAAASTRNTPLTTWAALFLQVITSIENIQLPPGLHLLESPKDPCPPPSSMP